MAAGDLARKGYDVHVFVPLLPWYYYFVSLGKHPLRWLRYVWPHLIGCIQERRFSFHEMLSDDETHQRVRTKFVLRKASTNHLRKMDYLVLISVEQMTYYRDRFPQEKQIYLLLHPEERVHANGDLFTKLRKSFRGKTLVVSPVIAQEVSDHIIDLEVVPIPVSPVLWDQRSKFDPSANRKDILLSWKDQAHGTAGSEIIRALTAMRPETTFTVWCTVPSISSGVEKELPGATIVEGLNEVELGNLYLNHSMLIYPSTYEGFGMPPIEALACGCIPVLHPRVGAAELYARDGENSVHLSEDPQSTASRIAGILDNAETLITMRKHAPQSINEFDPLGYGERILAAAGAL